MGKVSNLSQIQPKTPNQPDMRSLSPEKTDTHLQKMILGEEVIWKNFETVTREGGGRVYTRRRAIFPPPPSAKHPPGGLWGRAGRAADACQPCPICALPAPFGPLDRSRNPILRQSSAISMAWQSMSPDGLSDAGPSRGVISTMRCPGRRNS